VARGVPQRCVSRIADSSSAAAIRDAPASIEVTVRENLFKIIRPDSDGAGVNDEQNAFPDASTEWADLNSEGNGNKY
jgi:hypothetical protein